MQVYLSISEMAAMIENHYIETHTRMKLSEAAEKMLRLGKYRSDSPNLPIISRLTFAPEEEFLRQRTSLYAEFDTDIIRKNSTLPNPTNLPEEGWTQGHPSSAILNLAFYQQESDLHSNGQYFEADYLYHGSCTLSYENEQIEMQPGALCLIAPSALCDIRLNSRETFLIQVHMNYNMFNSAFISVLSETNILSNFFKAVLLNQNSPSCLLLETGDSNEVRFIARQLYLEQYRFDMYSPKCSANWLQQLFFYVLRIVEEDCRFAAMNEHVEFGPIFKYLKTHYQSTSLQELADRFHYTPSYLSTAIKKATGKTYTEMIREMKIGDACRLLESTRKSIEEIATLIGYNSADQFTRAFRICCGTTPSHYRKEHFQE